MRGAVCRLFVAGRCKRGDRCRYRHDLSPSAPTSGAADHTEHSAKQPPPCAYFSQGKCRRGSRCHFSHNVEAGPGGGAGKKKASGLSLPPVLDGSGQSGSLFRKLVECEVNAEENVLLQCLRYLVNNRDHFAGIATDDPHPPAEL